MEQRSSNNSESAINLLRRLITIPSFSGSEDKTAQAIEELLSLSGIPSRRKKNNIWAVNKYFDSAKPTVLLNSHHDTVRPNSGYTRDPFNAIIEDGKLFGLGSNDAGGALVSLLATFLELYSSSSLGFNLMYSATAEEENSGANGIECLLGELGEIELAIVGEPTQMKVAVAERGLMVLDCVAHGIAGHAARDEGVNAISKAIEDITWFQSYRFERVSEWLDAVGMNVTMISAGTAHNQVPERCSFVVDLRINECYTHEEILAEIQRNVKCAVTPRSLRMKSSSIPITHPFVAGAIELGYEVYGSPTSSDTAIMPWNAVKIGPGDSARSHSADEFIYVVEIEQAIEKFLQLLLSYSRHHQENPE